MKKALAALAVLFVLCASPCLAEIQRASFASASLGRDVGYLVELPPSYAGGERRFPALYLLHGLFESSDFYERRGLAAAFAAAREAGELPEALVVAVDGSNSFFVNGPAGAFEDMVVRDLVEHVEKTYRAAPGRANRALFGVSMGGYAALRIAFKHPDRFAAVATHSAMILEKIPSAEDGARRGQMAAFGRVFGTPIDPAAWAANDPLQLVAKADVKALPALYLDCGSEDRFGLYVGNRDLHERLEARGVKHEFGLYPGDHGYDYVKSVIARSLRFLGAALKPAAGTRD